jgi:hypothetical protein
MTNSFQRATNYRSMLLASRRTKFAVLSVALSLPLLALLACDKTNPDDFIIPPRAEAGTTLDATSDAADSDSASASDADSGSDSALDADAGTDADAAG